MCVCRHWECSQGKRWRPHEKIIDFFTFINFILWSFSHLLPLISSLFLLSYALVTYKGTRDASDLRWAFNWWCWTPVSSCARHCTCCFGWRCWHRGERNNILFKTRHHLISWIWFSVVGCDVCLASEKIAAIKNCLMTSSYLVSLLMSALYSF